MSSKKAFSFLLLLNIFLFEVSGSNVFGEGKKGNIHSENLPEVQAEEIFRDVVDVDAEIKKHSFATRKENQSSENCIGLAFGYDEGEAACGISVFGVCDFASKSLRLKGFYEFAKETKGFYNEIPNNFELGIEKPFNKNNFMFELNLSGKRHGRAKTVFKKFPSFRQGGGRDDDFVQKIDNYISKNGDIFFSIIPVSFIRSASLRSGLLFPGFNRNLAGYLSFGIDGSVSCYKLRQSSYQEHGLEEIKLQQKYFSGWAGLEVVFDTTNDKHFPTKGVKLGVGSKIGLPQFSSKSFNFIKASALGEVYCPLTKNHNVGISLKARAGIVDSFYPDDFIPQHEFFYAGGSYNDTIRGFSWGEAGPYCEYYSYYNSGKITREKNSTTILAPLGGKNFFCANGEFAFPLIPSSWTKGWKRGLQGYFLYDIGSAWEVQKFRYLSLCEKFIKNEKFNLHQSVGVGIKAAGKHCAFKLEYAQPIYKKNRPLRGIFSLGMSLKW
jgi:hypothetical protein